MVDVSRVGGTRTGKIEPVSPGQQPEQRTSQHAPRYVAAVVALRQRRQVNMNVNSSVHLNPSTAQVPFLGYPLKYSVGVSCPSVLSLACGVPGYSTTHITINRVLLGSKLPLGTGTRGVQRAFLAELNSIPAPTLTQGSSMIPLAVTLIARESSWPSLRSC